MNKLVMIVVLLAGALAACRSIPTDKHEAKGGPEHEYARLLEKARQSYSDTPRSIEDMQSGAKAFADALAIKAEDYDALWQAARTSAWLAEFMPGREERRPVIKEGIKYANTALTLRPDGVEARFYHGVLAGLLGEVDNDYGLDAARTVEADMKELIARDADIANGGPWRVLGALYTRAPGPPTSVGSLRNARKMLSAALEKAPDWPENHLYVAELEMAGDHKGSPHSAKERLDNHLLGAEATAPPGFEFEFAAWQEKARALLRKE